MHQDVEAQIEASFGTGRKKCCQIMNVNPKIRNGPESWRRRNYRLWRHGQLHLVGHGVVGDRADILVFARIDRGRQEFCCFPSDFFETGPSRNQCEVPGIACGLQGRTTVDAACLVSSAGLLPVAGGLVLILCKRLDTVPNPE